MEPQDLQAVDSQPVDIPPSLANAVVIPTQARSLPVYKGIYELEGVAAQAVEKFVPVDSEDAGHELCQYLDRIKQISADIPGMAQVFAFSVLEGGQVISVITEYIEISDEATYRKDTLIKILETLKEAYSYGFWHGALHPNNILLTNEGTVVKITDWGNLARNSANRSMFRSYGARAGQTTDAYKDDCMSAAISCLYRLVPTSDFSDIFGTETLNPADVAAFINTHIESQDLRDIMRVAVTPDESKRPNASQLLQMIHEGTVPISEDTAIEQQEEATSSLLYIVKSKSRTLAVFDAQRFKVLVTYDLVDHPIEYLASPYIVQCNSQDFGPHLLFIGGVDSEKTARPDCFRVTATADAAAST